MKYFDKIPFNLVIISCLTLGLAPFRPPHVYEKIMMIFSAKPLLIVDWFDLLMHGSPWIILVIKIMRKKLIAPK